jgi:ribonuclease Y
MDSSVISQTIPAWQAFLGCLVIGLPAGWFSYSFLQSSVRKRAQAEANDILKEAQDKAELILLEEKEKAQEVEDKIWTKEEPIILKLEEKVEELEELVSEKKQKLDDRYSQERQKTTSLEKEIQDEEARIEKFNQRLIEKRNRFKTLIDQMKSQLAKITGQEKSAVIEDIKNRMIDQSAQSVSKLSEIFEEHVKENQENLAKKILATALDRFSRPFCPERGIPGVYVQTEKEENILIDSAGKNLSLISELSGCDVSYDTESKLLGVAGFDPVRRELTRRMLEKLLTMSRPIDEFTIKKTHEVQKRELIKQIKTDGDDIAKELKLDNLHPEVKQMMGSLRFRYSFTQNQYFHCAEVGWLCGLIASELGQVSIKAARRSGLLHDLGKSMDHELDGGHAMIGADFIQARNEKPEIVHAVRAHHYDEHPTTDLAYCVIAADAISGARPGARRSTVESYNQKVSELERIAMGFDGVRDCFVLNGGRECRVMVDSRKITDPIALDLSKKIATQIEAECNYPGQIKVVVVRETISVS